jgi:lipid-binding SYLF domain-containing protein
MNKESRDVFLKNEWTLGTEVAVTGGPVGRRAKAGTSWKLTAGLLSYSRSKGLFAGVSLEGGKVKVDDKLTAAVYGNASVADILYGKVAPAAESAGVKVYPEGLAKYDRSVKRR